MNNLFNRFARLASDLTGSATSFLVAITVILVWGVSGPIFGFSDTWQLVINTGTTIVTFLMVFLIQNTQNRDSKAMHLKLDELIRIHEHARNSMMDLEKLNDEQLARLQKEFDKICNQGREDEDVVAAIRKEAKLPERKSSSKGDREPNPLPGPSSGAAANG